MHIFTTLGRADPELFRRWLGFGGALARRKPSRPLSASWWSCAPRPASVVGTSGRSTLSWPGVQGVTPAELAALGDGAGALDAVEWSPLERAALRAVDETADDGAVSDATWGVLAGTAARERAH